MPPQATPGGIGELPPPVGPPVARPRRPRIWIVVAGGWMALCWLLLIGSAVTADLGGVLLAVVAMLPVNLLWRFRYWRAKATPETADLGTRTAGVWIAGFVFPMRDALRELRGTRPGAPPPPLSRS